MTLKKIVCLITVLIMTASSLVGCGGNKDNGAKKEELKIAMVTSVGGVTDGSFNQSAWEGLQKAEKDLGIKASYIESKQEADYVTNLEQAVDNNNDLILATGFPMQQALLEAAKNYPEQKFAIVDVDYGEETPDNVTCISFNEEQSGYVVGLVAGKMTKTNKVGFVGGMNNVVIKKFQVGYEAGVKEANSNAKVLVQYVNSFADQAKGKSIANQMYNNNADILFACAGDSGLGVLECAKETGKYAIGVDRDQNNIAPGNILTSAMKKVNEGVYTVVENLKDGKLDGGKTLVFGLKEEGIGLAASTDKNVPKDVIDYVNSKIEKIISGEIVVPNK
ncbi:BMP family lipoprotein [Terrisporobacter sp.]|uniref:BMP family lipoprotein n=1 Tax=Terrisporobacter sp. TaxID=1965305 RepID=UPI001A909A20|nr:BMP family ABC transporter substrate-binding protein [Terrisporobacter sp.]MBN9648662.1 BMP family ABC transporter substrate-binding protein [Terrisporobacter glycolicus]